VVNGVRGQRIHPLCVLWGALVFIACLLMVSSPAKTIILFIIVLATTAMLRFRLTKVLCTVCRAWPILLVTFVVHAVISYRFSAGLASFGDVFSHVTGSLGRAALFTSRLALMLLTAAAVFELHAPQRYGQALGRLFARLPLGRKTLAQVDLAGTLALRFVPFIASETGRLRLALAARGQKVASSRFQRLLTMRKLLFPLLVSALRRADHVADALTVRGYDPTVIRTNLHTLPLKKRQLLLTGGFTLLCVAVPWI
jgi:energy-coupling factor transporter transmembrane protein EcfT